jgi:hypothetical protein
MATCVLSSITFKVAPVQAAAFSFSGSRLMLDNVSHLPEVKDSTLITDAIANTRQGSANNDFDGNLDFVVADQTRLDGVFETRSQGEGSGYFGRSEITSNAFAQFLATPQQPLSFDFTIASLLRNTVDTVLERATAKSNITLSLLAPDQTVLQFFTLDARVNTSPFDQTNNEALQISTSGQILGSNRQLLPGINDKMGEEIGNISFLGRFEQTVSQPTLLTLQVNTRNQSCIQAPNAEDACVKVPEASFLWAFSLVTALGLLVLPRQLRSSG